jgi:outer membrane protein TolC
VSGTHARRASWLCPALALWLLLPVTPGLAQPALTQAAAPAPEDLLPPIDDAGGQVLTSSQTVERALQSSRALEVMQDDVAMAVQRLGAAKGLNNPELRFRTNTNDSFKDRFDLLAFGLRWQPPELGELGLRERTESVRLWEGRVDAARKRLELAARARRAYEDLVVLEQLYRLRRERLEMETRRVALVGQMKDLGRRTIVYFTKARMRLGEHRTDLYRLEQARSDARRELERLAGLGPEARLAVKAEPWPEVVLTHERMRELAARHHPEAALLKERSALAQARYDRERFRRVPWPTFVELGYHAERNDPNWIELRLGLELPLFNWNGGNVRAAELAVTRKETQAAALDERLGERMHASYAAYRDAWTDWQLSSRESATLIADTRAVIATAAQHQNLPADELLELELTILDARAVICEKRHTMALALIKLLEALGVEDASGLDQPTPAAP